MIDESGARVFRQDALSSFLALKSAPLLPLISVLLAAVAFLPQVVQVRSIDRSCMLLSGGCPPEFYAQLSRSQALSSALYLVVVPAALFGLGWLGTERIWFLRLFRGQMLTRKEGWSFTWSFLGRYLVLALLMAAVAAPLFIYVIGRIFRAAFRDPQSFLRGSNVINQWETLAGPLLIFGALFLIAEFVLTFVTPALAFSTRKVSSAIRIGLRTIKDQWPRSAWYVFFPPLAFAILARSLPASFFGTWIQLSMIAVATLVNLWFKGATAAFYLRVYPAGDDGAVHASS